MLEKSLHERQYRKGIARSPLCAGNMQHRPASTPRSEPKASAKAILAAADAPKPPLRLLLGPDYMPIFKGAYASRMATWEEWRDISSGAAG